VTRWLFAIACICFVVSLPFRDSWAGKRLRFWALLLTVLAFGPPIVWNVIMHGGAPRASAPAANATPTSVPAPASPPLAAASSWRIIAAGAAVCVLAFLILTLRRRLRPPPSPWWQPEINVRQGGTPVTGIPPAPVWPVSHDSSPPSPPGDP